MQVSDIEMAMADAFGRRLRADAKAAQSIVDRKNLQLGRALGRIASLEAEVSVLRRERTARGMQILAAAAVRNSTH
jgi:hypothetical protein